MEDVKDLVDRIELIVKEDPGARNISSLWIEGELWNSVNAILNKDVSITIFFLSFFR